jgi:hypothetical protein
LADRLGLTHKLLGLALDRLPAGCKVRHERCDRGWSGQSERKRLPWRTLMSSSTKRQ